MRLPDSIHFSRDYLYMELGRLKTHGSNTGLSKKILAVIPGNSPSNVGSFFKTIKAQRNVFVEYLGIIVPRGKSMTSLDLGARRPRRIEWLRRFFADKGFTVWVATR